MWKITCFSGSTAVRRPSAVNPGENSYRPNMLRNYSSLAIIFSLTFKAHVHSVTHGQIRRPFANRPLSWIGHSGSFKVIINDVGRNRERRVVVMYNNVDLISETYERCSNGKTANSSISTTPPLRFDGSCPRKAFEYLQIIYITRNWRHWPTFLPLMVWVFISYFSRNYLWKSNPLSIKVLARKPSVTCNSTPRSF